ncbi:MAG: T9SS type A sorting domain-containing protein, partial [Bacteroidales bacterium]|nr:T9SS type A sorting domain-containing protein [Bacteroidales bacterium]
IISNQIITDYYTKTIDIQLQKTSTVIDESISSSIIIVNPIVNHRLIIRSPHMITEIKIYSVLGQLLYAHKTNANEMEINLEHWKGGVYLIDMEITGGKHIRKRIIAQ